MLWHRARNPYRECGPHQIAAVLRAHGIEAPIESLYASAFHRRFDWMLPWDVSAILRRFGIRSKWGFVTRRGFAECLKSAASKGTPALFVINSIHGTGSLHWIGSWGYDGDSDEFLCYDSQAGTTENEWGNFRYSPARLRASLPWRGTFAVVAER